MTFLGVRRNRLIFIVLLVVLLLLMLQMNIVQPLADELDMKKADLTAKQREYAELKRRAGESGNQASQEHFDLTRLRSAIPEEPHLEQLLETMGMLEAVSGVSMNSYQFSLDAAERKGAQIASSGTATAGDGLMTVRLDTSVEGTYSQVMRMLDEIHDQERVMSVERLEMAVQGEDSSVVKINVKDPKITCTLTIVSYYAPELKAYVGQTPADGGPQSEQQSGLLY